MPDLQTLGMIVGAVMIVAALLYVLERRSKSVAVDYLDLAKLTLGAGVIASGVVYTVGTDSVVEVAETVTTVAQDMFVGKPDF
jgi:hypothetical protein